MISKPFSQPALLAASVLLNVSFAAWLGSHLVSSREAQPGPSISELPAASSKPRELTSPAPPAIAVQPPAPSLASPAAARAEISPPSPRPIEWTQTPESSLPFAPALESAPADSGTVATQVVNSEAPGNSLHFRGMRVALAGVYHSSRPENRALAVDVSQAQVPANSAENGIVASSGADATAGTAAGTTLSSSAPTENASSVATRTSQTSAVPESAASPLSPQEAEGSSNDGFTREEELFRMKWGWAAFDAARTEARKAGGPLTPP